MLELADRYLAFLLFIPWFGVLGALYWAFPRQPRHGFRRLFDGGALTLAALASLAGSAWAHGAADLSDGPMWRQILASLVGYGLFLLVLAIALPLRGLWLAQRART